MKPVLQIALDFINLSRALKIADSAVKGGADWIEAGTPLIKSEGLDAVRSLREKFHRKTIVADMKTMDAGRVEVESAAKAGADVVCVLALSSESTVREAVRAGRNYGVKIEADLIGIGDNDLFRAAKKMEEIGVDYLGVHCPIDDQMKGKDPFSSLKKISGSVHIPIAAAGGINKETALKAVRAGADIVVVGGAVTKDKNPQRAAKDIRDSITKGKVFKTRLFKRAGLSDVYKILELVSSANLSDAMHRSGDLKGIVPLYPGIKMAGEVLTVRTYPGDWAKTVESIDLASKGQVIVIDAGSIGPAVWGELATHSALKKKLAGVVIDGAVRDTAEIRKLKFPVFSRLVMPAAGEPKGFGEIGIPITAGGVRIFPGDWILGDDDGVVRIPKEILVETANRAMGVLEQENRLREEIESGSTLSKVMNLLRWEKKG